MRKFFKQTILGKKLPSKDHENNHAIVMMESDTLGMTVVEQDTSDQTKTIQPLSTQEWVQIISSETLNGFSYSRIYFSFLKGLPECLRMKIWLFLVKNNNTYDYRINPSKIQEDKMINQAQQLQRVSGLKTRISNRISYKDLFDLDGEKYMKLALSKPAIKQYEQIQKDIHRSFAGREKYCYTQHILRRNLYALSNWGVQYSQGMNYILLNVIIFCLQSLGLDDENYEKLTPQLEKQMFTIMVGIVSKMQETFGNNNIFKVMKDLQQKIAESEPETLFMIYNFGMDCFSCFSQYYYSVMSYNDPPQDMCKYMMDLFFLQGQKAIHSMVVRMLEIANKEIAQIKNPQAFQSFVKKDIFYICYKTFKENQAQATKIQDFGMSFYNNIQKF